MVEQIDPNQLKQMQQIEEMKRQILNKILTKEAFERLGRVRTVNPQLAGEAELYILQIYQSGKLQDNITDGQMKEILSLLSSKRDFRIKRK